MTKKGDLKGKHLVRKMTRKAVTDGSPAPAKKKLPVSEELSQKFYFLIYLSSTRSASAVTRTERTAIAMPRETLPCSNSRIM